MSDLLDAALGRREKAKPVEHHFFDYWRQNFDALGWKDAADNVGRYLGASGAEKVYSEEQIARMPPVTHRINRNNTYFESNTFTGRSGKPDVNEKLLSLQPGKTVRFEDKWVATYSPKSIVTNTVKGAYDWLRGRGTSKLSRAYDDLADTLVHPDTYATIGSFPIESGGSFEAKRDGNRLAIKGSVRHSLSDSFNFDPGQLGHAPGKVLERQGLAAAFPFRYESEQDVEAEGEYGPSGITLKRATWGQRR